MKYTRIRDFFKDNRHTLIRAVLTLAVLIGISLIALLILEVLGVFYHDDGLKLNTELFHSLKQSWYGCILIILIQAIFTTLLCFVPGTSMAFIVLMPLLYEKAWQAFLMAFAGVVISSIAMYLAGRYGGYRLCEKILGKRDTERAAELLNDNGLVYFPLMMLFPMFPDDALVMIAGTLKMSFKWFITSILTCRGVGIATIIFGLGSIPYERFTTPWHWIIFIAVCAVGVIALFYFAHRLNVFLKRRRDNAKDG